MNLYGMNSKLSGLLIALVGYSIALVCCALSPGAADPGVAARPSHIQAHFGTPPDELLAPLAAPQASVLKGYMPAQERQLAQALQQRQLHQRLLKVAVAEMVGRQMGLIKLQASDRASGVFRVVDLESDAVAALESAFDACPRLEHLDLWSVVPGEMASYGQINEPVFSVSVSRKAFERYRGLGLSPRQMLGKLGSVRYAPLFLDYAADNPIRLASLGEPFPPTAFCAPDASDRWTKYLTPSSASGALDISGVRVLLQGPANKPYVGITIDDGPHPLIIPLMLAVLDHYDVNATFFVVGRKAEQYPGLVREMAQAGHELGNHTYWHRRLSRLSEQEAGAEVRACSAVIGTLTGRLVRYIRPPGGDFSRASLRAIARSGLTVALWTHNTGDWHQVSPGQIANRALAGVKPGSIILMHDGDLNSVKALELIIEGLQKRGLKPVTLSELGRNGGVQRFSIEAMMNYLATGWQPAQLR